MFVPPVGRLRGEVELPGDKSISHRYAILGAIAQGETRIRGYSPSQDCESTLACLRALGVEIESSGTALLIRSRGMAGLSRPPGPLDAGNSGTTMRLLSGVLAALPFPTVIGGDASLNRRPMARIIEPLGRMGARIETANGEFPPLHVKGGPLRGIDYTLPVASAQVKSCVLLAGLNASGRTTVRERMPSRDHTERALPQFGVSVERRDLEVSLQGPQQPQGTSLRVPGDFSAAAFLIVASLLVPGSKPHLDGVGLNPTRTGLLQLLDPGERAIRVSHRADWNGEPVGRLTIGCDPGVLEGFPSQLAGRWIPNVIDEIPILAVLGTRLPGGFRVSDAAELRKKESDRIAAVTQNLDRVGVRVEEYEDGFCIPPGQTIRGGSIRTCGDHRIAMAFAVAGLISRSGVRIDDPDCSAVSFPGFFETLEALRA